MDQKQFVKTALRLPPEIHRQVHDSARLNSRTFNAEILHQLGSVYASTRVPGKTGQRVQQQ